MIHRVYLSGILHKPRPQRAILAPDRSVRVRRLVEPHRVCLVLIRLVFEPGGDHGTYEAKNVFAEKTLRLQRKHPQDALQDSTDGDSPSRPR